MPSCTYIHCWTCKEKNTCATAKEIEKQIWDENCKIVREIIGVKETDSDFDAFWHILEWERQEWIDAWSAQPTSEEYEEMMREDEEEGYP